MTATASRPIRTLSPLVASQIAAGEVVERPASVVKELVENSIDAGATRIEVELEQGGIELVRVSDDGGGIAKDDLPLALAPHATSKVGTLEDLDRIATLGFRGEALASIASVSRLTLRSRTPDSNEAFELKSEGEAREPIAPASSPVGTTLSVRNLFFNTPARRKFLKTVGTEQGRCADTLTAIALAHPLIGFVLRIDGKMVFDLAPNQSPQERALALLGSELEPEMLVVQSDQHDSRGVSLWGLVGTPSIARATNKSQHVFVNGRAVRDRTVQHAIMQAYRGLIEPSRFPTAVLMLELSPEAVDVNVHPTKAEVRFRDSSLVHSVVYHAISRALKAADLTPTFFGGSGAGSGGGGNAPAAFEVKHPTAIMPSPFQQPAHLTNQTNGPAQTEAFVEYLRRFTPGVDQLTFPLRTIPQSAPAVAAADGNGAQSDAPLDAQANGQAAHASSTSAPEGEVYSPKRVDRILQVHNSYVVTQDDQGVVIVDQHALHERVMFEALLARVGRGNLESQTLLTPALIDATADQLGRLEEMKPLLERIGVDAEPAGPRSIAVRSFPSFLFSRNVDPIEFMADLFSLTDENEEGDERPSAKAAAPSHPTSDIPNPTSNERLLRDVLDMMACKAAIKAGDHLSDLELDELLRLREAVERSSNCPHGRPTTVRLTIRELERLFGRA
ncbi:MAG: DNA mismatch repair endonuclease MutL [Phycisphaeraceae bacterium]|nr:DNA mismatch repair endonuclease MutL [Phycisphaeraceae bacterium]